MANRQVTVTISAQDAYSGVIDRYGTKMGQAKTATENMNTTTQTARTRMDGLKTAVGGVVAGLAVREVINFGVEMANLGRDVNLTRQRFDELVAPLGDAESIMQRLREASLGTASDQALREGSNLLLMTGVASSPEELEQIIGLITRTKKPTEDLGTAIENFGLLLTNQSLLRLDSFGISSGRVRERIIELQASMEGLTREDAFRMATLEEMSKLTDRLGDSAEAASTPLARLTTDLQNFKEQAGANIHTGLEGTVGIIEIALGQHPEQIRQAEEAANQFAADFQTAMDTAMSDATLQGADPEFVSKFMTRAIQLAQDDPTLAANAQALRDEVLAEFGVFHPESALGPEGGFFDVAPQINALSQIASQTVVNNAHAEELLATEQAQAAELERIQGFHSEINRLTSTGNDLASAGLNVWETITNRARELTELEQQRAGIRSQMEGELGFLEGAALDTGFEQFIGGGAGFEGQLPDFMGREQADRIVGMAEEARRIADEMERLDKLDDELFTDDQLANAQATADNVTDMATEAERAADAFERISVADVFGQTGGGLEGELTDLILKNFGGTDEQQEALARELNLQSGRETGGSLFLQDVLIPEIAAAGNDPEIAAAMQGALAELLKSAAMAGVDTSNPEFLAELQTQISDVGLLGLDTDKLVEDFSSAETSLTTMGEQSAMTAENTTAVNEQMGETVASSEAVATNTTTMATSMGKAADHASDIQSALQKLTSTVHKVKVQIEVDVTGDSFDGLIENAVRNNGGVVPGTIDD